MLDQGQQQTENALISRDDGQERRGSRLRTLLPFFSGIQPQMVAALGRKPFELLNDNLTLVVEEFFQPFCIDTASETGCVVVQGCHPISDRKSVV